MPEHTVGSLREETGRQQCVARVAHYGTGGEGDEEALIGVEIDGVDPLRRRPSNIPPLHLHPLFHLRFVRLFHLLFVGLFPLLFVGLFPLLFVRVEVLEPLARVHHIGKSLKGTPGRCHKERRAVEV